MMDQETSDAFVRLKVAFQTQGFEPWSFILEDAQGRRDAILVLQHVLTSPEQVALASNARFPWMKRPGVKDPVTGVTTVKCTISLSGVLRDRSKSYAAFRETLQGHIALLRSASSDAEAVELLDDFLQIWSDN